MTIEKIYSLYLDFPSVVTDTRRIKKDDIFFALKGPNFNGNQFAKNALEAGAAYCIIDEPSFKINEKTILVDDVLTTLQLLAKEHRRHFDIPFLAITGSNGKTTTKELIYAVLSSSFITCTTEGNLNNHIGVPLTILRIKKEAAIAVIEMGANHQKEIAGYCEYTNPTHGIITNCGKAHLEGFGGVEGVKKGKGELFDFLRLNKGIVFINSDYEYLLEMSKGIDNIITYGTKDASYLGYVINNEPFIEVGMKQGYAGTINTQLVGDYNLPNILAAVTIGKYFGVDDQKIKNAIENYHPTNSRSQLIQQASNNIVLDAYNANPSSMKAAIENFSGMHAAKKILILGAMAELGAESLSEHQNIVSLINHYKWDHVVLVGGDFLNIQHPFISFKNSLEAKHWYHQQSFINSTILIKGSRSMQMEKIIAPV